MTLLRDFARLRFKDDFRPDGSGDKPTDCSNCTIIRFAMAISNCWSFVRATRGTEIAAGTFINRDGVWCVISVFSVMR